MKNGVIKQHYSMSPVLFKYCMICKRQKRGILKSPDFKGKIITDKWGQFH